MVYQCQQTGAARLDVRSGGGLAGPGLSQAQTWCTSGKKLSLLLPSRGRRCCRWVPSSRQQIFKMVFTNFRANCASDCGPKVKAISARAYYYNKQAANECLSAVAGGGPRRREYTVRV